MDLLRFNINNLLDRFVQIPGVKLIKPSLLELSDKSRIRVRED